MDQTMVFSQSYNLILGYNRTCWWSELKWRLRGSNLPRAAFFAKSHFRSDWRGFRQSKYDHLPWQWPKSHYFGQNYTFNWTQKHNSKNFNAVKKLPKILVISPQPFKTQPYSQFPQNPFNKKPIEKGVDQIRFIRHSIESRHCIVASHIELSEKAGIG